MVIQPNSTVNLYSGVDIDMGSGVQIAFSSIANQRAYFNSKLAAPGVTCTVVKKTGRIRLEAAGTLVKNCNYISFVNPAFDNKTIYARILDYDYINNDCTEIVWQIDFWQTWMFEINFEESGIARQYLNEADYIKAVANPYDPSIYAFQTPEALPVNEGLEEYTYEYDSSNSSWLRTDPIENNTLLCTYGPDADEDLYNLKSIITVIIAPFSTEDIHIYTGWEDLTDELLFDLEGFVCQPNANTMWEGHNDNIGKYVTQGFIQSSFPHPYWILGIPLGEFDAEEKEYTSGGVTTKYCLGAFTGVTFLYKVINYLTSLQIDRNILSIHYMPDYMFRMGYAPLVGNITSETEVESGYDEHTYKAKTSYAARNNIYTGYTPSCQKLYTHPYSYLRLTNNVDERKEYQFERFSDVQSDASATCDLIGVAQFNVIPSVSIAPVDYKRHTGYGTAMVAKYKEIEDNLIAEAIRYKPNEVGNVNFDERIDITSFPQVPVVTDNFLAHISSTYMGLVANNTSEAQEQRLYKSAYLDGKSLNMQLEAVGDLAIGTVKTVVNTVEGGAVSGGASGIGAVSGGASAIGVVSTVAGAWADRQMLESEKFKLQTEKDMLREASSFISNPTKDIPRFEDTKAAFAANIYRPGTVGGLPDYYLGNTIDFKLTYVKLRDAILEKYDKYFKTYGYNFGGVVDVPYVVKYTQGLTGDNNLPHWEQVGGKDSTYIKTYDCHCTHSMLPVAVAIEGMFNSGVRMLKGETL